MKIPGSRRILIIVGAATGACAIAVPAALGLSGNPSFSQRIPVRAPSSAHVVQFGSASDDHGVEVVHRHHDRHATDPAHSRSERRGHRDELGTAGASTAQSEPQPEPGDDNGVDPSTAQSEPENEPGDDNGVDSTTAQPEPGDDNGGDRSGTSTSADTGGRDSSGDTSGSGDRSGSDDTSGSGDHGGSDDGSGHGGSGHDGSDG